MAEPKRLAVIFARSADGTWLAQIPALRGCRTQGQTMAEAIERIRQTLTLFREDAGSIELRPIILGEP